MIKRPSHIAVIIFFWFLGNILFFNPLQCLIYFLIIWSFILVVTGFRFQTINRRHGSFQNYIDNLNKSDKYVRTISELTEKFSWSKLSLVQTFLYCARENITQLTSYIQSYQHKVHQIPKNPYASSGLSTRPKTTISKMDKIKMYIEALGLNPDEVLSREALGKPQRNVVDSERRQIRSLSEALKNEILMEFRIPSQVYVTPE